MKAMLAEQRTVIDNPLSLKRADEGELNTSDENAVETTAAPKARQRSMAVDRGRDPVGRRRVVLA